MHIRTQLITIGSRGSSLPHLAQAGGRHQQLAVGLAVVLGVLHTDGVQPLATGGVGLCASTWYKMGVSLCFTQADIGKRAQGGGPRCTPRIPSRHTLTVHGHDAATGAGDGLLRGAGTGQDNGQA